MSELYAFLGAGVALAIWTALVALATWRVSAKLRDEIERADEAEDLVAARDLADEQATSAQLRKIIDGLRERAKELGYEGQRADEEAERRLAALDLARNDPAAALGMLLGAEGADGYPPGGEGALSPPPGPTA